MDVRRWLLTGLVVGVVVLIGFATVTAQQTQPSLVEHFIEVQLESGPRLVRFFAIRDESNGVTCYILAAPGTPMECVK